MNKHQIHPKGYVMILISALCFGSYGVWSRLLGHEFGAFYQAGIRALIILAMLVPYMLITKKFRRLRGEDRKWMVICMAFSVCTNVPIYYAFNHLAIGTATLIFYAVFLITSYLVGRIFLNETITKIKVASIVLALLGLLLTFGVSLVLFSVGGLILAAANGVASGGEVSTSKMVTQNYPSLMVTFWSWLLTAVTHLPLSLIVHERWIMPSINGEWLAMLAYALAGLAGFWLVVEGFKFVDASIGSLIGLLEIVFSVVFGIVLFGEHLTPSIITGGMVIIVAAMLPDLTNLIEKRRPVGVPAPIREM